MIQRVRKETNRLTKRRGRESTLAGAVARALLVAEGVGIGNPGIMYEAGKHAGVLAQVAPKLCLHLSSDPFNAAMRGYVCPRCAAAEAVAHTGPDVEADPGVGSPEPEREPATAPGLQPVDASGPALAESLEAIGTAGLEPGISALAGADPVAVGREAGSRDARGQIVVSGELYFSLLTARGVTVASPAVGANVEGSQTLVSLGLRNVMGHLTDMTGVPLVVTPEYAAALMRKWRMPGGTTGRGRRGGGSATWRYPPREQLRVTEAGSVVMSWLRAKWPMLYELLVLDPAPSATSTRDGRLHYCVVADGLGLTVPVDIIAAVDATGVPVLPLSSYTPGVRGGRGLLCDALRWPEQGRLMTPPGNVIDWNGIALASGASVITPDLIKHGVVVPCHAALLAFQLSAAAQQVAVPRTVRYVRAPNTSAGVNMSSGVDWLHDWPSGVGESFRTFFGPRHKELVLATVPFGPGALAKDSAWTASLPMVELPVNLCEVDLSVGSCSWTLLTYGRPEVDAVQGLGILTAVSVRLWDVAGVEALNAAFIEWVATGKGVIGVSVRLGVVNHVLSPVVLTALRQALTVSVAVIVSRSGGGKTAMLRRLGLDTTDQLVDVDQVFDRHPGAMSEFAAMLRGGTPFSDAQRTVLTPLGMSLFDYVNLARVRTHQPLSEQGEVGALPIFATWSNTMCVHGGYFLVVSPDLPVTVFHSARPAELAEATVSVSQGESAGRLARLPMGALTFVLSVAQAVRGLKGWEWPILDG